MKMPKHENVLNVSSYMRFWFICVNCSEISNIFISVGKMKQLFQDKHIDSIMIFLKEINLFNKI